MTCKMSESAFVDGSLGARLSAGRGVRSTAVTMTVDPIGHLFDYAIIFQLHHRRIVSLLYRPQIAFMLITVLSVGAPCFAVSASRCEMNRDRKQILSSPITFADFVPHAEVANTVPPNNDQGGGTKMLMRQVSSKSKVSNGILRAAMVSGVVSGVAAASLQLAPDRSTRRASGSAASISVTAAIARSGPSRWGWARAPWRTPVVVSSTAPSRSAPTSLHSPRVRASVWRTSPSMSAAPMIPSDPATGLPTGPAYSSGSRQALASSTSGSIWWRRQRRRRRRAHTHGHQRIGRCELRNSMLLAPTGTASRQRVSSPTSLCWAPCFQARTAATTKSRPRAR